MKKIRIYLFVAILFVLFFGIYVYQGSTDKFSVQKQPCPDEFSDTDAGSAEYLIAIDKWTNDFYDTHQGASLSDWSEARFRFWIENDYVEAIKRYKEANAGKADTEVMERIQEGLREALE